MSPDTPNLLPIAEIRTDLADLDFLLTRAPADTAEWYAQRAVSLLAHIDAQEARTLAKRLGITDL